MPQTRGRIFDDFASLMTNAAGVANGVKREAETAVRTQVERILSGMNVVTREEFEAVPRHGGFGAGGERGTAPAHRRPRGQGRAQARHRGGVTATRALPPANRRCRSIRTAVSRRARLSACRR